MVAVLFLRVLWEPNFRNEELTTDSSLMCAAEFMGFIFYFLNFHFIVFIICVFCQQSSTTLIDSKFAFDVFY